MDAKGLVVIKFMRMKHIAIIGAGFAGLAMAWELLERGAQVSVYDAKPLGGGCSGMAAGLLHPFTGVDARLAPDGLDGLAATKQLLDLASSELGRPCYSQGILRLAVSERQRRNFARTARKHPEQVSWLTPQQCAQRLPMLDAVHPGLHIPHGLAVHSTDYLSGLWKALERRGAVFIQQRVAELPDADHVVIAAGWETPKLPSCHSLPLKGVKGQLLELEWDMSIPAPKLALNAVGYMLMHPDGQACSIGSTYEHDFAGEGPDPRVANPLVRQRIRPFFPAVDGLKMRACRAGIRACSPDHRPLVKQVGERVHCLTGFGSKGLLYAALWAKRCCGLIFSDS